MKFLSPIPWPFSPFVFHKKLSLFLSQFVSLSLSISTEDWILWPLFSSFLPIVPPPQHSYSNGLAEVSFSLGEPYLLLSSFFFPFPSIPRRRRNPLVNFVVPQWTTIIIEIYPSLSIVLSAFYVHLPLPRANFLSHRLPHLCFVYKQNLREIRHLCIQLFTWQYSLNKSRISLAFRTIVSKDEVSFFSFLVVSHRLEWRENKWDEESDSSLCHPQ